MKKTGKRRAVFGILMLALLLTGCTSQKKGTVSGANYYYPQKETESSTEERELIKAEYGADLYLIISNDMEKETMILKQLTSGKQYFYTYTLTTRFLDKYGSNASADSFEAGRLVTLNEKDQKGQVKEIQISDEVWEYENVIRYEIDEERGVFQIADTKYYLSENTYLVSDNQKIKVSDLKEEDELRVIGMNKEILSIAVTTGHGTIELQNTELFEGSFVQVGHKIFAEITAEMELEVPEGTYTLSVANKGYGGSKEITVERNRTLVIDLEELKGDGPKKGSISFVIAAGEEEAAAAAVLKIDGEEIKQGEAVELDYGIHSIWAFAEGYETFSKKLFVNSAEAVITIALSEAETGNVSGTVSTEASAAEGSLAGSQAGSLTGGTDSNTQNNTGSSTGSLTEELTSDYLTTLTELLGNLF